MALKLWESDPEVEEFLEEKRELVWVKDDLAQQFGVEQIDPPTKEDYEKLLMREAEMKEYYKNYHVDSIENLTMSLDVFNSIMELDRKSFSEKKIEITIPNWYDWPDVHMHKHVRYDDANNDSYTPPENIVFYKKTEWYTYEQRESLKNILDLNAPSGKFDTRIAPVYKIILGQMWETWLKDDIVEIYVYDPNFLDWFDMDEKAQKEYKESKKEAKKVNSHLKSETLEEYLIDHGLSSSLADREEIAKKYGIEEEYYWWAWVQDKEIIRRIIAWEDAPAKPVPKIKKPITVPKVEIVSPTAKEEAILETVSDSISTQAVQILWKIKKSTDTIYWKKYYFLWDTNIWTWLEAKKKYDQVFLKENVEEYKQLMQKWREWSPQDYINRYLEQFSNN